MKTAKLLAINSALILSCALLFTGSVGAAEKNRSVTPAEARKISKEGFLFGLPVVYIALSADVGSNVPKPKAVEPPSISLPTTEHFQMLQAGKLSGPTGILSTPLPGLICQSNLWFSPSRRWATATGT